MRWTDGDGEVMEFRAAIEKVAKAKTFGSLVSITRKDGETVEGLLHKDFVTNDYPYSTRCQGHVALHTLDRDIVQVCYLDIQDAECTESDEKMEAYMDLGVIESIDTIDMWL